MYLKDFTKEELIELQEYYISLDDKTAVQEIQKVIDNGRY